MKTISRRQSLAMAAGLGAGIAAAAQSQAQAQASNPMAPNPGRVVAPPVDTTASPILSSPVTGGSVTLEREDEHTVLVPKLHHGKAAVTVRKFNFQNAQSPNGFVTYVIQPGASEGVHVHGIGMPDGPFDEYYYVLDGHGHMEINGVPTPVKAGDHVHVPMGVPHGIENTADSGDLKVMITFIRRA